MKFVAASLALLFLPASVLAAVGGRCSSGWGNSCICLDANQCVSKYRGFAVAGSPGNWPCPSDPNNVVACYVSPCPKASSSTFCTWRNGCKKQAARKWIYPSPGRSISPEMQHADASGDRADLPWRERFYLLRAGQLKSLQEGSGRVCRSFPLPDGPRRCWKRGGSMSGFCLAADKTSRTQERRR